MADVKFSELSAMTASDVASADLFAVVDTSESASKQLSVDNLFGAVPVNVSITDLTQSTSNTTGSITTTGGLGVSKNSHIGGNLNVYGDSQLIINQLNGIYKITSPNLIPLYDAVKNYELYFNTITYNHVKREHNKVADKLANEALDNLQNRESHTSVFNCLDDVIY